jgi:hypothetical protein
MGNQIVTVGCELAGGVNLARRDGDGRATFGPPLDNMRQCLLSGGIHASLAVNLMEIKALLSPGIASHKSRSMTCLVPGDLTINPYFAST